MKPFTAEAMAAAETARDRLWSQMRGKPGVEAVDIGVEQTAEGERALILRVHGKTDTPVPESVGGIPVRRLRASYRLE